MTEPNPLSAVPRSRPRYRPRDRARSRRPDRASVVIALVFGLIGFALFRLAFSIEPGTAVTVALACAIATYLGRTPLPGRRPPTGDPHRT